jgi:hypothetical protein
MVYLLERLWLKKRPCADTTRFHLFIDNYGAQDSLVKGSASVLQWRKLLMILEEMDDELFSCLWVTRVPSHSNPADHPLPLPSTHDEVRTMLPNNLQSLGNHLLKLKGEKLRMHNAVPNM